MLCDHLASVPFHLALGDSHQLFSVRHYRHEEPTRRFEFSLS